MNICKVLSYPWLKGAVEVQSIINTLLRKILNQAGKCFKVKKNEKTETDFIVE